MSAQEIMLVVARAANGVIGACGSLPWHLPGDLRHFKALTIRRPMIMGRKTFASLPGLLPERRHIVLTHDRAWAAHGAEIAHSPDEALALAGEGVVAVIGGAEIFALFLPRAARIELTEIHAEFAGDTVMAPLPPEWRELRRESHPASNGRPSFDFVTLGRP